MQGMPSIQMQGDQTPSKRSSELTSEMLGKKSYLHETLWLWFQKTAGYSVYNHYMFIHYLKVFVCRRRRGHQRGRGSWIGQRLYRLGLVFRSSLSLNKTFPWWFGHWWICSCPLPPTPREVRGEEPRILFLQGIFNEVFFIARPVWLVYSFRFAVGWEFFYSGLTSSMKMVVDLVTVCLCLMRFMSAVVVSFFPCHQRSGSADDRSAVSVGRSRGSVALALAVVSKVWSCVQR